MAGSGSHDAQLYFRYYRRIYVSLLVLLVVSIIGPEFGIQWVTLLTAFGIALVKANMVIQSFMHLGTEKRIIKWMLTSSVILMVLFFAGVAPDVMRHEGQQWVNTAALDAIERGIPATHAEGAEGEHAEPGAEEHAEPPSGAEGAAGSTPAPFDAASTYQAVCSACHGVAGAGDGAAGAVLDPRPSDFTQASFWNSRSDDEVFRAIREGGAAVGRSAAMPAWGSLLDEPSARLMVEYLETFRGG